MMTIRPFDYADADYEAFAAVERSIWPGYPDTVEEWRHRDGIREPGVLFCRYLAEVDGAGLARCLAGVGVWGRRCSVHRVLIRV